MKDRKQFVEHRAGRPCRFLGCNREAQHIGDHNEGGWSPFYCRECDTERTARIDKSLREIGASMPTKTKKAPKAKNIDGDPLADATDTNIQNAEKMKKIRAQRRVVKKCEIDVGNATESRKLAKEELEAARAELYRLIDDSPQGELFVSHVDTKTGEMETDDDE